MYVNEQVSMVSDRCGTLQSTHLAIWQSQSTEFLTFFLENSPTKPFAVKRSHYIIISEYQHDPRSPSAQDSSQVMRRDFKNSSLIRQPPLGTHWGGIYSLKLGI